MRVAHPAGTTRARSFVLRLFDPDALQNRLVIGPATAYAHPYLQKDLAAEQAFHVVARVRADRFEFFAAPADDDGFLVGPLDQNGDMNSAQVFGRLEGLDFDRRGVGKLVAE